MLGDIRIVHQGQVVCNMKDSSKEGVGEGGDVDDRPEVSESLMPFLRCRSTESLVRPL